MDRQFFVQRAKQLVRYFTELGLLRSVFVFGIAAYLFFFIASVVANGHSASLVFLVFSFLTLALHFFRSDKIFFEQNEVNPYLFFSLENLILLLPIILIYLIYNEPKLAVGFILLSFAVPLIPLSLNLNSLPIFKSRKAKNSNSIEANFHFILFFFILGLVFSQQAIVVLAGAFAISVLLTNCKPELETDELNIKLENQLIGTEIIARLRTVFGVLSPLAVLFLVFNYKYWFVLLFFVGATAVLHVFTVLMFYAQYQTNVKRRQKAFLIGFGAFLSYMPWLSPLALIWGGYYYYKALKKLKDLQIKQISS